MISADFYRSTTKSDEVKFTFEGLTSPSLNLRNSKEIGQLIIPGVKTPNQNLKIGLNKVESILKGQWPNFVFEFERYRERIIPLKFSISAANNTVKAQLRYIQYTLALNKSLKYSLKVGRKIIDLPIPPLSKENEERIVYYAQICLKLLFIEEHFGNSIHPFVIPNTIPAVEVGIIEYIFRALTEGEFPIFTNWFELREMTPGRLNLNEPPFTEPGEIYLPSEPNKSWKIPLFGQLIDLGPLSITAKKATPYKPEQIERLRHEWRKTENIGIVCLDQEVAHHYDRYCELHGLLQQNLEAFKISLSQQEPKEFALLLEKSLVKGISPEEAENVALSWLIYNPLPNYFLPFKIRDDRDPNNWHVEIGLLNKEKTKGTGEIVGEIVINKKSGKIISHPTFENIWNRLLENIPLSQLPDNEIKKLEKLHLNTEIETEIKALSDEKNVNVLRESSIKNTIDKEIITSIDNFEIDVIDFTYKKIFLFDSRPTLENSNILIKARFDKDVLANLLLVGETSQIEQVLKVNEIDLKFSSEKDTANSEFIITTLTAMLALSNASVLNIHQWDLRLKLKFHLQLKEVADMLRRRRIAYQVMIIEKATNLNFSLPTKQYSRDEVANIDFIFKAITERKFIWPAKKGKVSFPMKATPEQYKLMPTQQIIEDLIPDPVIEQRILFGERINLGLCVFTIKDAILHNYDEVMDRLSRLDNQLVNAEFISTSGQFAYEFPNAPQLPNKPWNETIQQLIDLESKLNYSLSESYTNLAKSSFEGLSQQEIYLVTKEGLEDKTE